MKHLRHLLATAALTLCATAATAQQSTSATTAKGTATTTKSAEQLLVGTWNLTPIKGPRTALLNPAARLTVTTDRQNRRALILTVVREDGEERYADGMVITNSDGPTCGSIRAIRADGDQAGQPAEFIFRDLEEGSTTFQLEAFSAIYRAEAVKKRQVKSKAARIQMEQKKKK